MGATARKDYVGTSSVLKIVLSTALAGDTVTINGLLYTGVAGVKANNTQFSVDTSDTAAATDLADSINNDVRVGSVADATLVASSSAGVVTVTATSATPQAITAYSSDGGTIALSGEFFTLLGLASNVDDNNRTFKQINFMNTPFSVQQTGADKEPWKATSPRLVPITTEAEFNTLTARDRVLRGNVDGWVDSIIASTSLVFSYYDIDKNQVDTTLTMAEVLASGDLFFLAENY